MVNDFQGKLLWRFVMYWFIYQFTLLNIMFAWQVFNEGKGDMMEQYARFIGGQGPMLICLIVLLPCFAWDALRFSLRVAGPLHRIRTTIREIESGQTKMRPVKLRDGDYLQEIIDDLNAMIVYLEERNCVNVDATCSARQANASEGSELGTGSKLRGKPAAETFTHAV